MFPYVTESAGYGFLLGNINIIATILNPIAPPLAMVTAILTVAHIIPINHSILTVSIPSSMLVSLCFWIIWEVAMKLGRC